MALPKKKEISIHEREEGINDNLTIYEIEYAYHPRSTEVLNEDISKLVDELFEKHVKDGTVKDAEKAANELLEKWAKYHFGDAWDAVKNDKKHVAQVLEQKYGIKKKDLKSMFSKKNLYPTRDVIYKAIRDPAVQKADELSKAEAQASLDFYLKDSITRGQLEDHFGDRLRKKKLSRSYLDIMSLEKTAQIISTYMNIPGALEAIEKDKNAAIDIPDAVAGQPHLYELFDKGTQYARAYLAEKKKAEMKTKLKTK